VSTNGGSGGGKQGVSRLAAFVLRQFGEHPGRPLSEAEIGSLAGVDLREARQLVAWLERAGLLEPAPSQGHPALMLPDPPEQRRLRTRPLVLLVEDHASIAGMTEAVLTSEGYNVVLVRNPLEAHVILRVVTFDVILTDSFSPTIDLAARVLAPLLRRSAGTPVVLFTAHHWNPDRVHAEGFSEIITKPFDIDALLARVDQLRAIHRTAGA
jgi:two-component system, OmpR family, response regulator VicR